MLFEQLLQSACYEKIKHPTYLTVSPVLLFVIPISLLDVRSLCYVWGPAEGCCEADSRTNRCDQTHVYRVPGL